MRQERIDEVVRFTCWHCRNSWVVEYEVTHVEDGHGHECDYYAQHGQPTVTPTAYGGTVCPNCGALRLSMRRETRTASHRPG